MGTAAFAVPSLRALVAAGHTVPLVVTQPDRPAGRGQVPTPPPVKVAAAALGLPVWQPESLRDPAAAERLARLAPDAIAVAAYGKILPPAILDIPRLGCVNVHASLLPKYRGAAPVQWALYHGEPETGVTIMRMDPGLDTGPILLARRVPVGPDEDAEALTARLAEMGAAALVEALARLEAGDLVPVPQDDAAATYAPPLRKEQGRIDWRRPARMLHNQVRAFRPWPGSLTLFEGRPVKVLRTRVLEGPAGPTRPGEPGEVVGVGPEGIAVATGEGVLLLAEVQPAGGRAMGGAEFARGARITPGMRFA
ncbi:MAG TPA: methionyl-tRNA formyltransferase [Thermodesulfobacteriota bacterium]|nr:methionyl-tRNA formyltransferase [Thermodesulfobacteriota bacterium]